MNQGFAHLKLAELGIEPENNLNESIKLQQEAQARRAKLAAASW